MAKEFIDKKDQAAAYRQFFNNFWRLPDSSITESCKDLMPLLYEQIKDEYEFVQRGDSYKLVSNGKVLAQMSKMGVTKLSLPALKFFMDDQIDHVLGSYSMHVLTCIDLPNLKSSTDGFLQRAYCLRKISAPKLASAGKCCNSLVYEIIKKNTKQK